MYLTPAILFSPVCDFRLSVALVHKCSSYRCPCLCLSLFPFLTSLTAAGTLLALALLACVSFVACLNMYHLVVALVIPFSFSFLISFAATCRYCSLVVALSVRKRLSCSLQHPYVPPPVLKIVPVHGPFIFDCPLQREFFLSFVF